MMLLICPQFLQFPDSCTFMLLLYHKYWGCADYKKASSDMFSAEIMRTLFVVLHKYAVRCVSLEKETIYNSCLVSALAKTFNSDCSDFTAR